MFYDTLSETFDITWYVYVPVMDAYESYASSNVTV